MSSSHEVREVESPEQFEELIQSNEFTATIVDFTASWCPPCRAIKPIFEEMATRYTDIQFLKVDVDELKSVARDAKIYAMPTFIIYRGGERTNESIRGADKEALRALLNSVSTTTTAAQGGAEGAYPNGTNNNNNNNTNVDDDHDSMSNDDSMKKKKKRKSCCTIC